MLQRSDLKVLSQNASEIVLQANVGRFNILIQKDKSYPDWQYTITNLDKNRVVRVSPYFSTREACEAGVNQFLKGVYNAEF